MLTQLATKRGQKVVSTFKGIPPDLTEAELGNFKIGTNDQWNISVVSLARPYISLRSGSVHLNLEVFETMVRHNYGGNSSRTNFHAYVDAGLREFFTEVSEQEEPLKFP